MMKQRPKSKIGPKYRWRIAALLLAVAAGVQLVAAQSTLRVADQGNLATPPAMAASHVSVENQIRIVGNASNQGGRTSQPPFATATANDLMSGLMQSARTNPARITTPIPVTSTTNAPSAITANSGTVVAATPDLFSQLTNAATDAPSRATADIGQSLSSIVPTVEPTPRAMATVDSTDNVASDQGSALRVVAPPTQNVQPDLFSGLFAVESAHVASQPTPRSDMPSAQPMPLEVAQAPFDRPASPTVVIDNPFTPSQTSAPSAVAVQVPAHTPGGISDGLRSVLTPRDTMQQAPIPAPAAEPAAIAERTPVVDLFEQFIAQQPAPAKPIAKEAPSTVAPIDSPAADVAISQPPDSQTPAYETAANRLPPIATLPPVAVELLPSIAKPVDIDRQIIPPPQFIASEAQRDVPGSTNRLSIQDRSPVVETPTQIPVTPSTTYQAQPVSPSTPTPVAVAQPAPVVPLPQVALAPIPQQPVSRYMPISDESYRLGLQPVDQWIDSSTHTPSAPAAPPVTTFVFAGPSGPSSATTPGTPEPLSQAPPTAVSMLPSLLVNGQLVDSNGMTFASAHAVSESADSTGCSPLGCPYLPGQSGAQYVCGVDCGVYGAPCCSDWNDSHCIPWSLFGPGEYIGPERTAHVATYYLRVNDVITLTFITSRRKEAERYRIGPGDRLRIEWLRAAGNNDASLDREILVQPDGTIPMPMVGEIIAAGKTVDELRTALTDSYGRIQRDPEITVTPLEVNLAQKEVLNAVTSSYGTNGQTQTLRVTPEGTIQAPGLGSVYAQGLTLEELRSELEARYAATFGPGLLVSPSLTERATSYVFVGGEVRSPSRYVLEGPTTVMQAIALAGGWNIGGNLRQVVVFRRDENWCLKAIKIDVRAPLYGNDPCPVNDVWLRDNDLVIVPKSKVLCAADVIDLYFTRGVYAVFPISYVKNFSAGSTVFVP